MSAGKAVGNLLEELLKKDVGDITEDMISAVLKGATPKGKKDLAKGEYNLAHATTKIEEKMMATSSPLKVAPKSNEKMQFKTYDAGINISPQVSKEQESLVRQAYQKHFETDVTEDVYEAFRGTKEGYQAGMKTRLDKTGRHTGEFYTPSGKEDILEEVRGDRSRKTSPYQEDIDYLQGGRSNISRQQKAKAMATMTPEFDSEVKAGLRKQQDLYRRKEFGSAVHTEALPEFKPEEYKKYNSTKKNKKAQAADQAKANRAVDNRNKAEQKKYDKKVKERLEKSEKYTESIEIRGEVFEKTEGGATFYQSSETGNRVYRTKEGAKVALREQNQSNIKKYGEAYYDERLNEQGQRRLIERAAEVGGFENMRSANQQLDILERKISKGGTLNESEEKMYSSLKGDGSLEAQAKRDSFVFYEEGGKTKMRKLDSFHEEIRAKEKASGVADTKNTEIYENMEKAGYDRDTVIEFLGNKGLKEDDAYDVFNITKKGTLEYRPPKPSEQVTYDEGVFGTVAPERFYDGEGVSGSTYMKRKNVKARNERVNQVLGGEGWQIENRPHVQGGEAGTSVAGTSTPSSSNSKAPKEIVDYVDQKEYKDIYDNMMRSSAPASLAGGLLGGTYTFATQYDSNESFGTNMSRVGVNAAIGAAGGAVGGKLGKAAFDASAKRGSLFSNIMTASENYANANLNSTMHDSLQTFASGRAFMYGEKGGGMSSTYMQKLASASRVGMYAGVGLGTTAGVGTFGSSRNNKSSGLNQKRGNKF